MTAAADLSEGWRLAQMRDIEFQAGMQHVLRRYVQATLSDAWGAKKQLADAVDISRSNVSEIDSGKRPVSFGMLRKVAAFRGHRLSEMFLELFRIATEIELNEARKADGQ